MSKCRFGGAEGTEKSVFELMEWPSGEGWLHDESSCPCRVELKAHMSVSCRWARCAVEEGHDVERVTETLRAIRREKIDESASDVVGYGMVTRCHQHCGGATDQYITEQWTFQLCEEDGGEKPGCVPEDGVFHSPERLVCS